MNAKTQRTGAVPQTSIKTFAQSVARNLQAGGYDKGQIVQIVTEVIGLLNASMRDGLDTES